MNVATRKAISIGWAGLLVLAACSDEPVPAELDDPGAAAGPAWFAEEARERGLVFDHRCGHDGQQFRFPELMGGGVGLFDMDGDGDLDALAVQSGSLDPGAEPVTHGLFENDGTGHFRDVASERGLQTRGYGMGVAAGDYDGDGDQDLYLTQVGGNALLQNDGQGTFREVAETAGVADSGWGTSACFLDYDRDGDLDLFVTNYLVWTPESERPCFGPTGEPDYCGPSAYEAPAQDVLYRNEGDGSFTDVTEASGVSGAFGNGLGCVAGDFDDDGWIDLFVANDLTPDQLWINRGDGTFEDRAALTGVAVDPFGRVRAGMGVDAVDFDGDVDLDLIVVHMAGEKDGLFRNQGTYFQEETVRLGVGPAVQRLTRFGVGFQDFNQDSWLDLFVVAGRVNLLMEPLGPGDPYAEPNALLAGTPEGRWEAVQPMGGTAQELLFTSRGAAFGDVDGDGAVDVLVGNREGPLQLYRNVIAQPETGLVVEVLDEDGRPALGARVEFQCGERSLRRDVKPAYSYCSSSDPRIYLGLGAGGEVSAAWVQWNDGERERFEGPWAGGSRMTLQRSSR